MKTNDYLIPKMSLNEVAEKTSIPKYKLTYRLSHGHIPEPQKVAGRRLFSDRDLDVIQDFFKEKRRVRHDR